MQICENIKKARVLKGYTQVEMAGLLGLKRDTTYQNWEKATVPKIEDLKEIARVLEVPAHTLLQGVIDFSEEPPESKPDPEVQLKFRESELVQLKSSLDVLGSIFSRAEGLGINIRRGVSVVPLSDSKKPQKRSAVKGKQKGT